MAKQTFDNLEQVSKHILNGDPNIRVVVCMENGKYVTYRDPVNIRCHELREDLHAQVSGAKMQGKEAFIHPDLS